MKKHLITLLIAAALIQPITVFANDIPIRINRSEISLDAKALSRGDEVLLPLREIAYATGFRLRHTSDNKHLYLCQNGSDIACFYTDAPLENTQLKQYYADKIEDAIFITPETYVKIFGGSVAWDKDNNIVYITEKNYSLGLEEIKLYRPAENIVKTNENGDVYLKVYDEYSETMPIKSDVWEYTKVIEPERIPVVSIPDTHYGIDYTVTQGFVKRPYATITLTKDNETVVYTIHFEESAN